MRSPGLFRFVAIFLVVVACGGLARKARAGDSAAVHHFDVGSIASPQIRNASVPVTITARDVNGALVANFTGSVTFSATSEAGVLTCTPGASGAFVGGVWTGGVALGTYVNAAFLTVGDAQGHTGTSNGFALIRGPLDHFGWDPIAAPQIIDSPFTVTIHPQDAGGNLVEEFTGPVQLSAQSATTRLATAGGNDSSSSGLLGNSRQGRLQCIYTPLEVGGPGQLTALEFNVLGTRPATSTNFLTVRIKHTTRANYAFSRWETDGWTVVYQGTQTYATTGWVKCQFSAPFKYDGTSNLMVDFSYNNPELFSGSGRYRSTILSESRKIYYETNDNSSGDPLTWAGTSVPATTTGNLPMLRFTSTTLSSPIRPSSSGLFSGGAWSGSVSIPLAGPNVKLVAAIAGGQAGASEEFAVRNPAPIPGVAMVYREGFESIPFSGDWAFTGTSNFRTQVTTANFPHGGSRHLTMDANSSGSYARNEATWTVDLAGLSGLSLKFWAKGFSEVAHGPPSSPFVGGANFDGVAISADGVTWYEVQGLRSLTLFWVQYTVNLDAAIKALGLSYNSTFRIRFNQYDNAAISSRGIAVDDIEIVSVANPSALRVSAPAQLTEGGSPQSATVSLPFPVPLNTVLTLLNSAPAKISIPAQITIAAGQTSASFFVQPLDDTLVDGDKTVGISATSPYFLTGGTTLIVLENDVPAFTLSVQATTTIEGAAPVMATLAIPTPTAAPLTFLLTTSDATAISVPASVTMPSGETSVTVPLSVINDNKVDGPQTATVTVFAPGGSSRSVTIAVADNETNNLRLESVVFPAPTSVVEGAGTLTFNFSLPGTVTTATNVTFASSAPMRIAPPAAVNIAAGGSVGSVSFTVLNDDVAEGDQGVTLTASAAGFNTASFTLTFLDNDPHHFALSPVSSPQVRGASIPFIVTAQDSAGRTLAGFTGSVALSGASGGNAITTLPGSLYVVEGVWSGVVQLNDFGSNLTLTVNDGAGHFVVSNAFDVTTGPFQRFQWDAIASVLAPGSLEPVTVRAADAGGNFSGDVNGPITVRALVPVAGMTFAPGTTSSPFSLSIYSGANRSRSQSLYLAGELGGAQTLSGIAINLSSVYSVSTLTNFTVRLKTTKRTTLDAAIGWDSDSWSTVHQSTQTLQTAGWWTILFDAPFEYDGASNLLVDLSYNNAASGSGSAQAYSYVQSSRRTLSASYSSAIGDPLSWSGKTPASSAGYDLPQVRLLNFQPVPATIPTGPVIASGTWNGAVSFGGYQDRVFLEASDAAGRRGFSNGFRVGSPTAAQALPFVDGFENGTFALAWSVGGSAQGSARVISANGPYAGSQHAVLDSSSGTSRAELNLTLDLSGYTGVQLGFWAKPFGGSDDGPPPSPFTNSANFDGVAISADGVTWYEVQPLRAMTNGQWTQFNLNLDALCAARGLVYTSAFRIRFNQYGSYSVPYDGIAIDEVSVTGNATGRLVLNLPASIVESGPGATATLLLPAASAAARSVTLTSSSPQILSVPAFVTIPAGQTSVTFALTPVDNNSSSGAIAVRVSATTPGLIGAGANITVLDDEVASLGLSIPSPVSEDDGIVYGTLTLSAPAVGAIEVALTSSLPASAQVPATVTFPAGQSAVLFPITLLNDYKLTGEQAATLSVRPPGGPTSAGSFVITDNAFPTVSIYQTTVMEGSTSTGTVYAGSTVGSNLVVSLSCSDSSRLSVPATVTIPAGSSSAAYTQTAIDNSAIEGTQSVTVTVSAPGLIGNSAITSILDNDVHHFSFATIPSPQVRGFPCAVSVTARDLNNLAISSFSGSVTFGAEGDAGPLSLSLASSTAFVAGKWTGNLAVNTFSNGVVLTATDGTGKTGASNAFDVGTGPIHHYVWSAIPSLQMAGQPFTATLSAFDVGNNPATNSSGYVQLSSLPPERTIGTGTASTTSFPISPSGHDRRTQCIYLASEIGSAGSLTSISLNVSAIPALTLNNWTIRLKHTSASSYTGTGWDATGWTTVYQANQSIAQTGWVTFNFSTPFSYNGTSNLLVDFSFNNSSFSSGGTGFVFTAAASRTLSYSTNSAYGDPLTWSGSIPSAAISSAVPQIKFNSGGATLSVSPAVAFLSSGVWSGTVAVNGPASITSLNAIDFAGGTGQTNSFSVEAAVDSDGDGLPDAWENASGLASGNPAGAFGALGDPDRDGIPNLLEYAFNLSPQIANTTGLPVSAVKTNPSNGLQYLEFTYRRRTGAPAISYTLQTSADCLFWSATSANYEQVGLAVPVGDGETESVTARILPAFQTPGMPSGFVRLLISTP